jgi:hypothetical protein
MLALVLTDSVYCSGKTKLEQKQQDLDTRTQLLSAASAQVITQEFSISFSRLISIFSDRYMAVWGVFLLRFQALGCGNIVTDVY